MELIRTAISALGHKINLYFSKGVDKKALNVLMVGGFHGDEPKGIELLESFVESFTADEHKNNLYVISCLNPDGYAEKNRVNSNGVDINRNFRTQNWARTENDGEFFGGYAPASEPETNFMMELIDDYSFDCILSIHEPFNVINYDGPALNLAEKLNSIYPLPLQGYIGYPTPGSLGSYCGVERSIPTITMELGENEAPEVLKEKMFKVFDFLAKTY